MSQIGLMRIDDHNWVPIEWGPNKKCETIFNLCGNYFKGPAFVENMMVKRKWAKILHRYLKRIIVLPKNTFWVWYEPVEKKICQRQGFNTVIYYDRPTPIGQGTNQDKEYTSIDLKSWHWNNLKQ